MQLASRFLHCQRRSLRRSKGDIALSTLEMKGRLRNQILDTVQGYGAFASYGVMDIRTVDTWALVVPIILSWLHVRSKGLCITQY